MGSFSDNLSKLLAKITGKTSADSIQQSAKPQKFTEDIFPLARTISPATNVSKEREPYFFQIGFDFGTSSSKAVIRDINIDRAWVYTVTFAAPHTAFLIPSVVIYKDDKFLRHLDIDTLYPEGGLYHLKMAVEKAALGEINDPIFGEYRRIVGRKSPHTPAHIAFLASVFFLSSTFSEISNSIIQKFPDFGRKSEDQMAINMAIPVANISNNSVRSLFEKILNIAWLLGRKHNVGQDSFVIDELSQKVKEIENALGQTSNSELCHVYPEVSANVQAFVRSPASSPDDRTIYFFSDAGAGTVDQSVFTYAGGNGRRLNYFSAEVFPRGSGQIELAACAGEVNEINLEYWRKEKELGKNSPELNVAKMKVSEGLKFDSTKTLQGTLKCLPYGEGGITPTTSLKEKIKFIFSGGGNIEFPYQRAVVDAYKEALGTAQDPVFTSIARPSDLEIPQGYEHWINRLYVAYGLSFLFYGLAENTFPSENKLDPGETSQTQVACSCNGFNKNCSKCYGTGMIQP